ncbi:MAG: SRPBCC family protein [Hamadaea sp.]|nr:SRPBCC family protein [Hamadaea sp.]
MLDIIAEIAATRRETGVVSVDGTEARTIVMHRTYDAEITDVWDALTDPKRIQRWFLPLSGDLRLGGRFQFEGNAGGEVLACDPPRRLRISWVYGEPAPGDLSEVEIRLTADGAATRLDFEHVATVDGERWSTYGPGAVGVGWDGGLLGLGLHLAGNDIPEDEKEAWMMSPEAREFYTRSSAAWGEALAAAGADPEAVATAVQNTTEFYAPSQPEA